jgi:hypothetical protein
MQVLRLFICTVVLISIVSMTALSAEDDPFFTRFINEVPDSTAAVFEHELLSIAPTVLHEYLAEHKARAFDQSRRRAMPELPRWPGQEEMDVRYYKLEVRIDPSPKSYSDG